MIRDSFSWDGLSDMPVEFCSSVYTLYRRLRSVAMAALKLVKNREGAGASSGLRRKDRDVFVRDYCSSVRQAQCTLSNALQNMGEKGLEPPTSRM